MHPDAAQLAVGLSVALSRLRSRLREEARETSTGLTVSQLAMLQRLVDQGPMTAASLAAAEHVTKQAIAQRLALMQPAGLVETMPDPGDGRKVLIAISTAGRLLVQRLAVSRATWLARAIDHGVTADELPELRTAIGLLERLAGLDLSPDLEIR
jgi:DNA-binding MarR family transcriptional regulator